MIKESVETFQVTYHNYNISKANIISKQYHCFNRKISGEFYITHIFISHTTNIEYLVSSDS